MGKGGQGLTYATEGRDLNGLIRNGIGDMDNIYCVLTMYQLHSEACVITFNPHNDLLRRLLYCPDFTDKKGECRDCALPKVHSRKCCLTHSLPQSRHATMC